MQTKNRFNRREFLKTGMAATAAVTLAGMPLKLFASDQKETNPLNLQPESDAVLRVLRWVEFVSGDKVHWDENTKRWEQLTGNKVITEYISWEDVRTKAAMAASVGAGQDLVVGWLDDPHLYPQALMDLTDLADYLGKQYGGWESVCSMYGIDPASKRWIALPLGTIGNCMNIRKSWMKEAGFEKFPDDIQGFLKLCNKLKEIGHPCGFSLSHAVGDANTTWHWWLWSFGGKVVEKDGKTLCLNRQETWDALDAGKEFYESMISGVASWLDPHNNKAFLAGQIGLTSNGISIYYVAKEKFPEIAEDMGHFHSPIGPVGKPTELHLLNQIFVYKHCKYPQAAKHYILHMFDTPQYAEWLTGMRGLVAPSLKKYKEIPLWTADPMITPYRDATARMLWNGYEGPEGPASAATMAEYVVVDMFANVCLRGKSPKAAAALAQDRAARLYRR